ncbi:DUF4124 domain-containing protein [Undibacterium sp. Di27W]|uniref:DUF4124 domain-containing protein n=1 Tax=Undibacterium sp. Di27W TaxID=3413036 RepID=UPI003BEFC9FC
MKQITPKLRLQAACLSLLFIAHASHAEIYKWVDANGKTHYSEKKDDAGKAKVEEVKVKGLPESTNTAPSQSWQDREIEFRKRQVQKQEADAKAAKASEAKPPAAPDYHQETDASRCALAKDILSGKAAHGNGAKTDANDRTIAERDKSMFCH